MSRRALRSMSFDAPLAQKLRAEPGNGISLYWLGQAGFVIDAVGRRIVVDPYLSDSLATKYHGTPYPHQRMAPAPLRPDELGRVDLVLCTHKHTDHMDAETLRPLANCLPSLKFVVPAASHELARQRIGVDDSRLILVDAGERKQFDGFALQVMRAAHETLERDEVGHHTFLGYGLDFGSGRIFHSGDTIPFEGQVQEIRNFAPDLALLPVNGRSADLKTAGYAGNLTLDEAIGLCGRCGIGTMIAHHYGMFAFNTISADAIDHGTLNASIDVLRACYRTEFRLDDA